MNEYMLGDDLHEVEQCNENVKGEDKHKDIRDVARDRNDLDSHTTRALAIHDKPLDRSITN
jgi:hypothetical protein